MHGFSITETAARVAVVTYNDEAKVNMDLASGHSFRTVEGTIDDIKLSNKPNRNLEEALRFTNENVFSLKGGLRKVRIRFIQKVIKSVDIAIATNEGPLTNQMRLIRAKSRLNVN